MYDDRVEIISLKGERMKVARSFVLMGIVVCFCSTAMAQEDPIAAQVKAGLKDLKKPFTMVVELKVKENRTEAFEKAFRKAIKGTRKEKGNIRYELNRDTKEAGRYLVYERWKDFAALEAHLKTEHIKTLVGALGDLLDGPLKVQVLIPADR